MIEAKSSILTLIKVIAISHEIKVTKRIFAVKILIISFLNLTPIILKTIKKLILEFYVLYGRIIFKIKMMLIITTVNMLILGAIAIFIRRKLGLEKIKRDEM